MRKLATALTILLAGAGLAACGSTDYLNGGNVVSRSTLMQHNGVTITREYVTFADVLPGLATDHRNRWVAQNHGNQPRCVTVRLSNLRGTGGYRWGQIYLLPPGGARYVVAYHQAAYGHELGGSAEGLVWNPRGDDCRSNAPS